MIERQAWFAYCGAAPLPAGWLARWNLDPALLLALVAVAIFSARAVPASPARGRLWAAWGLAALLFVSPLCALGSALFSARALQHALLVAVVAPLAAGSVPRDRLPRAGSLPAWTGAHLAAIGLWHSPSGYAWAMAQSGIFWAMQLSLLGTAIGFWLAVRRGPAPLAAALLFSAALGIGLIGASMMFAPGALYTPHLASTLAWGLTPIEDQRLAGLVIGILAAIPYLAAALLLLARMLGGAAGRPAISA